MATLNTAKVETREEKCAECFAQCWFCSDYVWMVRTRGCGAGKGPKGSKGRPCPKSVEAKGQMCGTCGKPADRQCKNGGGMVTVERRVTGSDLT